MSRHLHHVTDLPLRISKRAAEPEMKAVGQVRDLYIWEELITQFEKMSHIPPFKNRNTIQLNHFTYLAETIEFARETAWYRWEFIKLRTLSMNGMASFKKFKKITPKIYNPF